MKSKILDDEYWMDLALREAVKARGRTSPNPMVGAVLVKDGLLLAKGYHRQAGLPHAEIEALKKVGSAKGATLYVTLEPCCHTQKRTSPCVDALVAAGIKKVVVGSLDPNPEVAGRGIKKLRRAGVQTRVGVLRRQCLDLNPYYNHWILNKTPWVVLKMAVSLDGAVALANGKSKWISSESSRGFAHDLRANMDGIVTGLGTIEADNPRLTARKKGGRDPVRIILDSRFQISTRARVFSKTSAAPCWVIVAPGREKDLKAEVLSKKNAEILPCLLEAPGRFKLKSLLSLLGKRGITSLLVEGGPHVWTAFIKQRLFHEALVFVSPKLLGGDAKSMLCPLNFKHLSEVPQLSLRSVEVIDQDVLLSYSKLTLT